MPVHSYSAEFERFWNLYPKGKRVGKLAAWRMWERHIKPLLAEDVLDALKRQVEGDHFPEDPTFIPLPTTWLNQGRWDDEITPKLRKAGYAAPKKGHFDGLY